jgi:hypothetical protein
MIAQEDLSSQGTVSEDELAFVSKDLEKDVLRNISEIKQALIESDQIIRSHQTLINGKLHFIFP